MGWFFYRVRSKNIILKSLRSPKISVFGQKFQKNIDFYEIIFLYYFFVLDTNNCQIFFKKYFRAKNRYEGHFTLFRSDNLIAKAMSKYWIEKSPLRRCQFVRESKSRHLVNYGIGGKSINIFYWIVIISGDGYVRCKFIMMHTWSIGLSKL